MRFAFFLGLALLTATGPLAFSAGQPFWGAKSSRKVDTDPATLKPGEFIWNGEAVPSGPVVVVVGLAEQMAYVYRNGIRVGVSTVSTGKSGHDTPTGIFNVLQRKKEHYSSTYNNAPMPYMERLTWDGVALHAGGLPGYPSSHGCVHLPSEFARELFEISSCGMVVVINNERDAPSEVPPPSVLSPVDPATGQEVEVPRLSPDEVYRWCPEKSPTGPVSIVVSRADQRVLVYRGGVEIGRGRIVVRPPDKPLGTHAFIMQEDAPDAEPAVKGAPLHRWLEVGIPGSAKEKGKQLDAAQARRVHFPPRFLAEAREILTPGTTLLITDEPVAEQTAGSSMNVMNADKPAEEK